jgi:hypothetical protein
MKHILFLLSLLILINSGCKKDIKDNPSPDSQKNEPDTIKVWWPNNFGLCKKILKTTGFELEGNFKDNLHSNYLATLNNIECPLFTDMSYYNEGTKVYKFGFSVSKNVALGKNKLTLKYKGTIIFEDSLEVLKGCFYYITSHPSSLAPTNHFLYNNQIYTYNSIQNEFWKWSPSTNQWIQLSPPDIELKMGLGNRGFEINGKIFFPPVLLNAFLFSIYETEVNDTYSISYDPVLDRWGKDSLTDVDNKGSSAGCYCSFAFNNKMYCLIRNFKDSTESNTLVMKVFNPADLSWKTILNSVPFEDAFGCSALVINNTIYLLPSFVSKNEFATNFFRNELYTLNIADLTFSKKSIWDLNEMTGVDNPYLFEYKGRLNLYGGEAMRGYADGLADLSFEYNINTDKWTPYYDYFGSCSVAPLPYAPRVGGFSYTINDKIYIGIGDDNIMTDIYSNIYEYYLE